MSETFKKWAVRSLATLGGLTILGVVVLFVLWAYQGHQAFDVIQNTIAQQQAQAAQQQRQMATQTAPAPPQATK